MPSIIGAIISAGLKYLLGFFMPSKDEKLGAAEATLAAQDKELKNVEIKNKINNRIDGAAAADIKRMSDGLDSSDK